MPDNPSETGPVPFRQLSLFPEVAGSPLAPERPLEPQDEPDGVFAGPSPDLGQIELFADRVVLARDLDLAMEEGRFEQGLEILATIDEGFGPPGTSAGRASISRLAAASWEDEPARALDAWAEVDAQLTAEPALKERAFRGTFTRLLRSYSPPILDAARPRCLPALFRALASGIGRDPKSRVLEARNVVRDALLADRVLDALDFRSDAEVADLLAEDHPPRWLACLGRLRRLWLAPLVHGAEIPTLAPMTQGEGSTQDPALSFWQCLRLAESPSAPDELRQQARRRMKQLNPAFHALFMRRARPG